MPSVANTALLCEPAYLWIPPGSSFDTADEVLDFARALGQDVAQPEIDAIRTLMAEGPDGQFAGFGSAIVCGRQNIKTWAIRMCVMYDAWVRSVRRITFSTQLFRTTRGAFEDTAALVENYDWLRKATKKVNYANGNEGFELVNGCSIDFIARSVKGDRGLGGDTVVLDEWLFGSGAILGALVPTMSTSPKPHILYGSSPGMPTSQSLRDIRDRGRSGDDPTLTYIEFSNEREGCVSPDCTHKAGRAVGCELDREEKWPKSNPALGRRISVAYVRKERREIPAAEFMRERMGWWEDPAAMDSESSAIPPESWTERLDADAVVPTGARVAFGVARSWDRQRTWIGSAAQLPDGRQLVQLVPWDEHLGLGASVVDWLFSRLATWHPVAIGGQGGNSPESSLLEDAQRRPELEPLVRVLSGIDVGQACGNFYDAATKGALAHIGQEQLDAAVEQAQVRAIGDSWVWDLKGSPVDVAGLKAVTVALHLLNTTTADQAPSIW